MCLRLQPPRCRHNIPPRRRSSSERQIDYPAEFEEPRAVITLRDAIARTLRRLNARTYATNTCRITSNSIARARIALPHLRWAAEYHSLLRSPGGPKRFFQITQGAKSSQWFRNGEFTRSRLFAAISWRSRIATLCKTRLQHLDRLI